VTTWPPYAEGGKGKGEGEVVPVLTPRRRMGDGGIAPAFLTSALDGDEWSTSRSGRFTPKERAPGNNWK